MLRALRLSLVLVALGAAPPLARTAHAQAADEPATPRSSLAATPAEEEDAPRRADDADLFYLTHDRVTLYRTADSTRPVMTLALRAPVHRTGQRGAWTRLRTENGVDGYVFGAPLSNVWVRISKARRTLYLYRGPELVRTFAADFGYNPNADKERRGSNAERDQWRTPEGTFYVARRNPRSQFYRAFVLSYPNAEHAQRGLARGLITPAQRDAIVEAERTFSEPPMNTALGGMIEIHGKGSGLGTNWTQGCVALLNAHVDALWPLLDVGTPVVIDP